MTERETVRTERPPDPEDGPRVGLASYDLHDPEATFRLIEPFRPAPAGRRAGFGTWSLGVLLTWTVNLLALAAAGLVVTNVGPYDPSAYVAWAAVFGLVNASTWIAARLLRRPRAAFPAAAALLAVDVVLVWLMTVLARPFHSPDLPALAKAGAIMWLANLPLALLYVRWHGRAAPRLPA
jgi:hypothetical protein